MATEARNHANHRNTPKIHRPTHARTYYPEGYQRAHESQEQEIESAASDVPSDLKVLRVELSDHPRDVQVRVDLSLAELRERIRKMNEKVERLQGSRHESP